MSKNAEIFLNIARLGNKYFDETAPWKSVKSDKALAEQSLFVCSELLRIFSVVFTPILPKACLRLREMMNLEADFVWQDLHKTQSRYTFGQVKPLFPRIEDEKIQQQVDKLLKISRAAEPEAIDVPKIKEEISFESFCQIDLRVGKVLSCQPVPKSKKLLRFEIDLGVVRNFGALHSRATSGQIGGYFGKFTDQENDGFGVARDDFGSRRF